jgi:predicted methyltransferase/DNA-directed RNA polymerase subunit RPC12/RpoP
VLRAFGELAPATTRSVSRQTGLPSPVVAAVSNELRARGLVTRDRPSRLTPLGQELLGEAPLGLRAEVACGCCHGDGLVPGPLAGLAGQLAELAGQAPPAEPALDQSHCTAETKLRRVLFLLSSGLLPTRAMVCVGDDDLMGVTVAMAGAALHRPLVQRLAVLDVSAEVLSYARQQLEALGTGAELIEHDLREPLPEALRGGFDLALTDPPYTVGGGRLFLSRAVEALRPGPGHAVAFSFGPKGPADTLRIQDAMRELGLTVQAMYRDFNAYLGAGVIGGHSHLYHLASTGETGPAVAGAYAGPIYTADARRRDRVYRCTQCGARHLAGPGAQWQTIAELKEAGCPACGGHRLRPLQLAPPG